MCHTYRYISHVYVSGQTGSCLYVCHETPLAKKKIAQKISQQLQNHEQGLAESAENEEMLLHNKALEEAMCVCV